MKGRNRDAARVRTRPKPVAALRARAAPAWLAPAVMALALTLVFVLQYAGALLMPLMTDDYLILAKLRHGALATIWAPHDLLSGYYRPWGRELHYAVLDRLRGADPLAFHAVGLALGLAAQTMYFLLVRRVAGTVSAALATALVATQAAWGVLMVWSAGSQDLWMMLAGNAFLFASIARRPGWAALSLAIALLSKETAATLPVIALLYVGIVERGSVAVALRRNAIPMAMVLVWALFHPMLGGLLGRSPATFGVADPGAAATLAAPAKLVGTLLALANADARWHPGEGWAQVVMAALPSALLLIAALLLAWRLAPASERRGAETTPPRVGTSPTADPARPPARHVAEWAVCWAVLGWLPFALPGLAWHAYYGLWGGFGAWIAVAIALRRARWLGVALVLALALIRPARAWTPQVDLGSEWYQARSAVLTANLRGGVLAARPALPPHSRVYFAGMPGGVSLISSPGHSPALEVWYGDPTLRADFYSHYTRRAAHDTLGADYFFLSDSTGTVTEVVKGHESPAERRRDPDWLRHHLELAALFARAGDHSAAVGEFEQLVVAYPDDARLRFELGACYEAAGRSDAAERTFRAAALLPTAGPGMLADARMDWGIAPR